MRRQRLGRRESKGVFRRTAGSKGRNFAGAKFSMRGGIRL